MSGQASDFDQWYTEASSLAEVLMRDHGCFLHNGPNPGHRACRACSRRVDLIVAWLREHGVAEDVLSALPFNPAP